MERLFIQISDYELTTLIFSHEKCTLMTGFVVLGHISYLWNSWKITKFTAPVVRRISQELTTSGKEQISTTAEVAMSRITIWISAPARRLKLRLLPGSDALPGSVPSDVRLTKLRCIRMSAAHTSTLHTTVTRISSELHPAYMNENAACVLTLVRQSMKHQVWGYCILTSPKPALGSAQNSILDA